ASDPHGGARGPAGAPGRGRARGDRDRGRRRPGRRRPGPPPRRPAAGRRLMDRTRCEGLIKVHRQEGLEVVALQGLDLEALPGEVTALVGPSGSGKTSLLMVLAAQDEPTAGRAWVAGVALHDTSESDRRYLRRSLVSL